MGPAAVRAGRLHRILAAADVGGSGDTAIRVRCRVHLLRLKESGFADVASKAGQAPQSTMGAGQQIVLTAPTSEWQKFVLLHAAGPDAWSGDEPGLHRVH